MVVKDLLSQTFAGVVAESVMVKRPEVVDSSQTGL
jgi:hypothetical protein